MKIKKTWLVVLVCVIALILLAITCRRGQKQGTPVNLIENVKIMTVHRTDVNDYFEVTGEVKAKDVSIIAARVMGTVTAIFVREGDKVSAGQELLTIDNADMMQRYKGAQAALESSKANKDMAEITYNRYKKLADEKAISGQEMDQVETQKKVADLNFERAQAALAEAKINLGFANVTSPTDGIVTRKSIDVGSMAMPGKGLLTVEDISSFKIEANIDAHLADQVKISAPIEAIVDAIRPVVRANITEMAPAIDATSRTFLIKAQIIEDQNNRLPLKTGLYARIMIPHGKKNLLVVPASAIVEKGQLVGLYVVDEKGIISYRLIRTGRTFGSNVEILSGLSDGQKVIVEGVSNAYDGGIVAVSE
jgi:RND family efflux transporter MFP subunit